MKWFEVDLAQGRWNEGFAKIINDFQDIQLMATKESINSQELSAALPGLVLRFNVLDDENEISQLLSLIDSIFSVSLIELQENIMRIENRKDNNQIMYYSHPYEQFCKENWSFLSKYLRLLKVN